MSSPAGADSRLVRVCGSVGHGRELTMPTDTTSPAGLTACASGPLSLPPQRDDGGWSVGRHDECFSSSWVLGFPDDEPTTSQTADSSRLPRCCIRLPLNLRVKGIAFLPSCSFPKEQ